MPIRSRFSTPIPQTSVPTWLFKSPYGELPTSPLIHCAENPDHFNFSLATYRLWSQRFAAGLQNAGLQPGDRVMLFSTNSIFFPIVFMGVLMSGGIFTGANPGFSVRELEHQLIDADCSFL